MTEYVKISSAYVGKLLHMVDARTNTYSLLMHDGKYANCIGEILEPATEKEFDMARAAAKNAAQKAEEKAAKQADREAKNAQNNAFLDGIRFVFPGYKDNAEPYAKHAMIYGGYITSFDGVVCYGYPIGDENKSLFAMPELGRLAAAAKQAGAGCTITQVDDKRLSIRAGKFRVMVQCLSDYNLVYRPVADQWRGALDRRMREAFEAVRSVTDKNAEFVLEASVLLRDKSAVAFSRTLIVEHWHGLDFPTLVAPAQFVDAVLKTTLPISGFGFAENSLTFWFEGGAFIRTALYNEKIPDAIDGVLPAAYDRAVPVPDEFFASIDKLAPFSDTNYLYLMQEKMQTHSSDEVGAQIEVPGLIPAGVQLDRRLMSKLKGRIKWFDYFSDPTRTFFWGDGLRGTCMNFVPHEGYAPLPEPAPAPPAYGEGIPPELAYGEGMEPDNVGQDQPQQWQPPQPVAPASTLEPAAAPAGLVFGKPNV